MITECTNQRNRENIKQLFIEHNIAFKYRTYDILFSDEIPFHRSRYVNAYTMQSKAIRKINDLLWKFPENEV